MTVEPTSETYQALQDAYRFFNRTLFAEQLPNCLITLQRRKRSYGYFSVERFQNNDGKKTDEIALLVHEMVHLWQHHHGKPSRRGYHNKEWAAKMVEVGLIPTDTGSVGGAMVGERMTHVVEPEGRFAEETGELIASGCRLTWRDADPEAAEADGGEGEGEKGAKKAARAKFRCPCCGAQAWAKPTARLLCGVEACDAVLMGEVEPEAGEAGASAPAAS